MIQPWTATCVQVYTHCVNSTTTRADAMAVVNKSVDRWLQLAKAGARMSGGGKQLMLFPEFALTGFPLHETAAEWIDKACIEIPGPVTERFQKAAHGGVIHQRQQTDAGACGKRFKQGQSVRSRQLAADMQAVINPEDAALLPGLHGTEDVAHAAAAHRVGVVIADAERIENRCNPGCGDFGIVTQQCRHGGPTHLWSWQQVALEVISMNFNQAR